MVKRGNKEMICKFFGAVSRWLAVENSFWQYSEDLLVLLKNEGRFIFFPLNELKFHSKMQAVFQQYHLPFKKIFQTTQGYSK